MGIKILRTSTYNQLIGRLNKAENRIIDQHATIRSLIKAKNRFYNRCNTIFNYAKSEKELSSRDGSTRMQILQKVYDAAKGRDRRTGENKQEV